MKLFRLLLFGILNHFLSKNKMFLIKETGFYFWTKFSNFDIVQQLSAVPFAKATASTAMARKKVKAVPILMAFKLLYVVIIVKFPV